jgi:hypothetical protein
VFAQRSKSAAERGEVGWSGLLAFISISPPVKELLRDKLHQRQAAQKKGSVETQIWNKFPPTRDHDAQKHRHGPNEHAEPDQTHEVIHRDIGMSDKRTGKAVIAYGRGPTAQGAEHVPSQGIEQDEKKQIRKSRNKNTCARESHG